MDILVEGVTADRRWTCGLEFDYANEESLYCRPLRLDEGKNPPRMEIPKQAASISVAFLPPMSGLAANETRLDLSSSGRGLQQTLLLLAYLYANPNSVLLLDEPDAHLEILRQRQIYQLLTEVAAAQGSQVIAASHSEVLLNEAAERDVVVAFVGLPHRIDDRGFQARKALREIGFEQHYQAEQTGWVLYLEGATDLAILRQFAQQMRHAALELLERPFVHYVQNLPKRAENHFYGVREAKPDLVGFALFDRIEPQVADKEPLRVYDWNRREIENYLCQPETLLAFAESSARAGSGGPLFESAETTRWREVMQSCIEDFVPPAALRDPSDRWWIDTKASGEFLDRVFEAFYERLNLPNLLRKTDYHVLAEFVPQHLIDHEIGRVLDAIVDTASRAKPLGGESPS